MERIKFGSKSCFLELLNALEKEHSYISSLILNHFEKQTNRASFLNDWHDDDTELEKGMNIHCVVVIVDLVIFQFCFFVSTLLMTCLLEWNVIHHRVNEFEVRELWHVDSGSASVCLGNLKGEKNTSDILRHFSKQILQVNSQNLNMKNSGSSESLIYYWQRTKNSENTVTYKAVVTPSTAVDLWTLS